jgi:uncharacterized protein (TIGR02391 family)
MANNLPQFERIARNIYRFTNTSFAPEADEHPFDARNIHGSLPVRVKELFDNGHYAEATLEAFKFVDNCVGTLAPGTRSGQARMLEAFRKDAPPIALTPMATESDRDEQEGYRFLFAGSMVGVRNPRAHDHSVVDSPDACLDHLSLASLLLRRLDQAGYRLV